MRQDGVIRPSSGINTPRQDDDGRRETAKTIQMKIMHDNGVVVLWRSKITMLNRAQNYNRKKYRHAET